MATDWPKVWEVFGSGILGVYLVMILLQLMTQLSSRVIDAVEKWHNGDGPPAEPKTPATPVKD